MKEKEYGFLHPGNWIYHDDIVSKVLKGAYNEITPYCAEFVATLNCSNRCGFCGYEESKRKEECWNKNNLTNERCNMPSLEESKSILYKLIDGGVKGIIFTGGGEPFLYPKLEELVGYVTQRKTDAVVYTNGNALNAKRINKLVQASPLLVRLSLNAGTKEVYNKIHNPLNPSLAFERALSSLENLAIGSRKNPTMDVGVGVVINEINQNDLVETAKRVREIADRKGKISFITYRPAFNYHALTQLQADVLDRTHEIVEKEVRNVLKDSGVKVDNVNCRYEALKQNTRNYTQCRSTGLYAEVSPPGELHLCCERNCHRDYIIGDLRKNTLKEIYSSEKRKALVNWINASECSTCFLACKPHETNKMFEKIEQLRSENRISEILVWLADIRSKPKPKMVNF